MRGVRGLFCALPLAGWLLAGCTGNVTPSYQGPVATNPSAATITVSVPSEQYSVSQNNSWIQIAAAKRPAACSRCASRPVSI
jgi:hypothetical protein